MINDNRKFWQQLCQLPKFSFLSPPNGGVVRVKDQSGNWVECSEVRRIVDAAEDEISSLRQQLESMTNKQCNKYP